MRLESAQDLKNQLLGELVVPFTTRANGLRRSGARAIEAAGAVRGAIDEPATFGIGARPFETLPLVQRSIALGVAPHGGQYRLAVRLQRPALRHSPMVESILQQAKGEAEVRLIGRIDKRARTTAQGPPWYRANTRPLLIGASVGHQHVTAGTIGGFVARGGIVHVLSNNHVLANEDRGRAGQAILQRGAFDGGRLPADRVARLRHWVRLRKPGANLVDAALGALERGVGYDPDVLRALIGGRDRRLAGLGPEFLDEGTIVHKIGRTTGPTTGRVTAFDVDNLVVNFDVGNLRFDGQIEIEGAGRRPFSDGGDSGSLIVDAGMHAVALLFAGSESGGRNNMGLTYANRIHAVLDSLGARLLP